MKKFFIRSFLFLMIICLIVQLSGMIMETLATHSSQVKSFWILSKKNQEYQTAFIGSSRVYYTLDARQVEEFYGGQSINLGDSGATYIDNYLILYLMVKKNHNKIKNLFLQVDDRSLNSENRFAAPFSPYVFYSHINDCEVSDIFIEKIGRMKYFLYKYFPPFVYIEYNNPYKAAAFGFFRNKHHYDETKGSEFKDGVIEHGKEDVAALKNLDMSISHDGEEYFHKIIDFAKKEGINVILYTSPSYADSETAGEWFDVTEKYIKTQALEYDVPYLNFNYSSLSNNVKYFYKFGHLNKDGVDAFMKLLLPQAKQYLK